MLLFRNVEQSVKAAITDLLTAPTGELADNPYTVYAEDDFRNEDLRPPTFPYLFLMGYRVAPRQTRLPMIILDIGPKAQAYYETGTRAGTLVTVTLHIFARTRGERDDLAAYLYQTLNAIAIYDYSGNAPTLKYTVPVEGKWSAHGSVGEDLGQEGSLSNWEVFSFGLQLLD